MSSSPTREDFDTSIRILGDLVDAGPCTAFEPSERYAALHSALMKVAGLLGVGGPTMQELEREMVETALMREVPEGQVAQEEPLPVAVVLRDVVDNGLIYWAPVTTHGFVQQALMFARAERALSAHSELPIPSSTLRRLSQTGSQGPWLTNAITGHLIGGMPDGIDPGEVEIETDENGKPVEEIDPDLDLYAEATLCTLFEDGRALPDDADLAAAAVNYVREVLVLLDKRGVV